MNILYKGKLAILLVFALFAVQTAETSFALQVLYEPGGQVVLEEMEASGANESGRQWNSTGTAEETGAADEALPVSGEPETTGSEETGKPAEEPEAGPEGREETDGETIEGAKDTDDEGAIEATQDEQGPAEVAPVLLADGLEFVLSDAMRIEAGDEDGLRAAVNSGQQEVEIHITADIILTETLEITGDKTVTLMAEGQGRSLTRTAGSLNLMIDVKDGGALTVKASEDGDELTLDFGRTEGSPYTSRARIINCEKDGTVSIEAGTLTGLHTTYPNSAVLYVGSGGTATMSGGSIEYNTLKNGYCSPVIIYGSGWFELAGGSIVNNRTSVSNQEAAGGVLLHGSETGVTGTFIMSDGLISENVGYCAGVSLYGTAYQQKVYFHMTGGTISHNTTNLNDANTIGGVFVFMNAEFVMDGGLIEYNTASMGGGVAVYDGGFGPVYKEYYKAIFEMNGGTIQHNQAGDPDNVNVSDATDRGCGGGVYTASYNVFLNGGNIINNAATQQGGGIYVGDTDYNVYLGPTVIKENHAVDQGRATNMSVGLRGSGGGIWLCHTGLISVAAANTIAIYDNTAEVSGTDFYSVPKIDPENKYVTMPAAMLGGGKFNWLKDMCDSVANHSPSSREPEEEHVELCLVDHAETYSAVTNRATTLSLQADPSAGAKMAAEAAATLFITGNTAPRGGGVGSNGNLYAGTEGKTAELNVKKLWEDEGCEENRPESIIVQLKTAGGHVLDEAVLNGARDWSHTFRELTDFGGSYYTVEEKALPEGYEASVSSIIYNEESEMYEITVTNCYTGAESGGEHGSVTLLKFAAGSQDVLADATFELYKAAGAEDEPGTLLGDWATDDSGTITISRLAFGEYYFVETEAPDGYELDGTPIHFTVSGQESTISLEVENTPQDSENNNGGGGGGGSKDKPTGSIRLVKCAEGSATRIAGAVYELYNSNGGYLSTHTTNADGTIAISGLKYGDYYLVEVKAPAGYKLDGNPIYFTISSSRAELEAVNHKSEIPGDKDDDDGDDDNNKDPDGGTGQDGNEHGGGSLTGNESGTSGSGTGNGGGSGNPAGWDGTPKTGLAVALPLMGISLLTALAALIAFVMKRN